MRPTVKPWEAEPSRISPPERFIGHSRVHKVAEALDTPEHVELNALHFDPGARSRPHTHNRDQILFFTEGPGIIAIDGGADQLIGAGESVMLPAGVPHMHGAPTTNPAAHLSIMPAGHDNDFQCPIDEAWTRFRQD